MITMMMMMMMTMMMMTMLDDASVAGIDGDGDGFVDVLVVVSLPVGVVFSVGVVGTHGFHVWIDLCDGRHGWEGDMGGRG